MLRDNPGSLTLDETYDAASYVASLTLSVFKGGR